MTGRRGSSDWKFNRNGWQVRAVIHTHEDGAREVTRDMPHHTFDDGAQVAFASMVQDFYGDDATLVRVVDCVPL